MAHYHTAHHPTIRFAGRYDAARWRESLLTVPRSRAAIAGFIVMILGIWAAIVPFIGGYFNYGFGSLATWHFTTARLWFDILPGAAAFFGGAIALGAKNRAVLHFGAWLALAGGLWLIVGNSISLLWNAVGPGIGLPLGGLTRQGLELLGFFYGTGAVITALSAIAIGRASVLPPVIKKNSAKK